MYSNPLKRRALTEAELHTADRMAFTRWSAGVSIDARVYVMMAFTGGNIVEEVQPVLTLVEVLFCSGCGGVIL
jgi:hypothetical protein